MISRSTNSTRVFQCAVSALVLQTHLRAPDDYYRYSVHYPYVQFKNMLKNRTILTVIRRGKGFLVLRTSAGALRVGRLKVSMPNYYSVLLTVES
jgi:hypothetical protein